MKKFVVIKGSKIYHKRLLYAVRWTKCGKRPLVSSRTLYQDPPEGFRLCKSCQR